MSIKFKKDGAYADSVGVYVKTAGVYAPASGVMVKAGGAYARADMAADQLINAVFASGLKGAWYERRRPVIYQESAALNLVAAAGNQVGLGLSRDQGLTWSPEKVVNGNFAAGMSGWNVVAGATADTSAGTAKIGPLGASGGFAQDIAVPINAPVDVKIVARKPAGTEANLWASPAASYAGAVGVNVATYQEFYWRLVSTTGVVRLYLQAIAGSSVLEVQSASVKVLLGNHQIQATPAARPLYQVGPQRLVFDGVDDVLNTVFPTALGTNCTVGRAVPGTGAVISTGVNIGTTFADTVNACALVIFDGALTASQTAALAAYLNQQSVL